MKIQYLLFLLPFFLVNCKNDPSHKKVLDEIAKLEGAIGTNPGSSQAQIGELLTKYEEFAAIPDVDADKKVDFLLRAGEMAALINQPNKSMEYYEKNPF